MNKKSFILIFFIAGALLLAGLIVGRRLKEQKVNGKPPFEEVEETKAIGYLVRVKRGCVPSEGSILVDIVADRQFLPFLTTQRFQLIGIQLGEKDKTALERDPCVSKISTAAEARKNFGKLPSEIQEAVKEAMKKRLLVLSLIKKDIIDREQLLEILKKEKPELPPEIISHYQLYITPETLAVSQLSSGKIIHQLYEEAVSWVWVSDPTLNSTEEKWLEPEEFLTNTPTYPTNPVPGKIASDCSEQANALASLLRAGGVSAENVRVVLGDVDFEGVIGGHAWVQVFEDGVWVDLDPTSGPYWDDEKSRLVQSTGLSFDYFKFFPFPVLDTWVYYNDVYFYDFETKEGNAPALWH